MSMATLRRRISLIGFALFAMGASVVAVTAGTPSSEPQQRPAAANSDTELPSPVPAQPTGELGSGHQLVTPPVANPHR